MKTQQTALLYDEVFLKHITHPGHPESVARVQNSYSKLIKQTWFDQLTLVSAQTIDTSWLRTVHTENYLTRAKNASRNAIPFLDSMDVSISPESFNVATMAVGGLLYLADHIMEGKTQNGFALLRPPGHHAEKDQAMGFCILNNVAILTHYLQKKFAVEKVAIFDWDVHHGNGTQHIFEADPSVLYISIHQFPLYPGTGAMTETGIGKGTGFTVNCPVPRKSGDPVYQEVLNAKVLPALKKFSPDVLILSAGFDAHQADPLAEIELSTNFFYLMTQQVLEAVLPSTQGKTISVLEGGYNLDALAESIIAHMLGLLGKA